MQGNQRQTLLAYAAGILDADGCFMVIKQKRKTPAYRKYFVQEAHSASYMPTMKICMAELEGIEVFLKGLKSGTCLLEGARKSRPTRQSMFVWYLRGKKIIDLLEGVIPYLTIKQERAIFLREFCIHIAKLGNPGYRGLTEEELNYREDSYQKMREFNSNKVAATTKSLRLERVNDSLAS